MCKMVFEVQGKTDNYVRLVKDGKGIEFLGKTCLLSWECQGINMLRFLFSFQGGRFLVEYEIQLEAMQTKSIANISIAVVKIVFR